MLQISLRTTLLLAVGILLTQASFSGAEDGHHSIQPIPESQPVQNNCQHCQNGNAHYGSCPSCQHSMITDCDGVGFCGRCRRRRRVSPGSGWCAPGKVKLERQRVQYWKYYPNYWSGNGPGSPQYYQPMVHTPTDTTQLGFYYQHAPTWTAQPWRIPTAPHPGNMHNRFCGRCKHRYHGQSCPTCYGNMGGYGYDQGYSYDTGYSNQGEYCPSCQQNAGNVGSTYPTEANVGRTPTPVTIPEPTTPKPVERFSVLPDAPPEI